MNSKKHGLGLLVPTLLALAACATPEDGKEVASSRGVVTECPVGTRICRAPSNTNNVDTVSGEALKNQGVVNTGAPRPVVHGGG